MNRSLAENLFCALSLLFILSFSHSLAFGQDKDWLPVTAAELAAKTPVVEPGADAEAIFWEVRVDDSSVDGLALKHYVRVKIFTERGREEFSKKDLVFVKGTKIKDVEARVTKPDGSNIFLKKEDVLEREIVKTDGFKVKAKSFALPGLEIGSIVEYRYREVIDNAEANMRLIFQREIPIQTISYYVKPFSGERGLYYQPFNVGNTKFEKDKNGFHRATMTKVPAFREEPYMLPEDEVRSWIYIYYASSVDRNPEDYWKRISKAVFESSKSSLKANDEVKRVTAETIAGATSDDEKLRKIYDYTKQQIKNLSYSSNVTDEERKKARDSKSAGDILKQKMGTAGDIDTLFGAMARAAGYDARIAFSGSRNELFFNPNVANFSLMLNSSSIAVKVGDNWRFFSPAGYFTPYGMMSWYEEDQTALITDSNELIWKPIPLSPSDKSISKRTGKFRILEDGTLEGEGKIEYTGHWAGYHKNINRGDSPTEQEKTFKDLMKRTISGNVEIEKFTIENVGDPEKPFTYTFKIRVPNYATKTGRRLFFQPNIFENQSKPRFTSSTRKYDVYITYPWLEQDDLTIELPKGFALENADAPAPLKDGQGIASHETKMAITADGRILTYQRKFSFGNGGFIRFPSDSYPAIKAYFEAFNKANVHQLTLRQATATAGTTNSN